MDRSTGRLKGLNRFGEEHIKPSHSYEDERGMRHQEWSEDPRSEAFKEKKINNYYGRGPKGYTRSDKRIREDVCELLTENPLVDASEIEVSVSEGLVTLEGVVESKIAKKTILEIVDDIPGIKGIHNHLELRKHVHGWIPHLDHDDADLNNDDGLGIIKGMY